MASSLGRRRPTRSARTRTSASSPIIQTGGLTPTRRWIATAMASTIAPKLRERRRHWCGRRWHCWPSCRVRLTGDPRPRTRCRSWLAGLESDRGYGPSRGLKAGAAIQKCAGAAGAQSKTRIWLFVPFKEDHEQHGRDQASLHSLNCVNDFILI
jgi:hypothetical protein